MSNGSGFLVEDGVEAVIVRGFVSREGKDCGF